MTAPARDAALTALRPRFLPDRDAAAEWGGKGAPIAKMIRRGFRVPPTAAFGLTECGDWLRSLPGHSGAIAAWRSWRAGDEAPAALAGFRAELLAQPLPAHFGQSVETLSRLLAGDPKWPLIVRSSMSAEDGAQSSLAGCFASIVVEKPSPETVWEAFKAVVASAFTPESARRLLASGADPADFRPGVVVQPYLVAELAGVCFSRDPLNPWNPDGQVEWVAGAGEALVQGTAPSRRRRRSEGPSPELASLWEELWTRARLAEAIVGGPADLEWVWDGETLWFVQARAIATEEARLAAASPNRRFTRELTLERFPEPITPMGWTALQDAFAVNLRTLDRRFGIIAKNPAEMAVSVRGVVYSDPAFFAFPGGVKIRWSTHLAPWKRAPWAALRALGRHLGRRLAGRDGRISAALLKLDLADAFLGAEAHRIEASWNHHRDSSVAAIEAFSASLTDSADPARIRDAMDRLGPISAEFMEPDLAVFLIKDVTSKALKALWEALGRSGDEFPDLVRSFDGNRTLLMNQEWAACVAAIRADSGRDAFCAALGQARQFEAGLAASDALGTAAARDAWTGFLSRNGHSTTSWDLYVPTWRDEPARLEPLLRASLKSLHSGKPAAAGTPGLREERRRSLDECLTRASLPGARPRILASLRRMESFMRIDEEHHFLSGILLGPSRRIVLAAARALRDRGILTRNEADSVFFITLGELQAGIAADGARPPCLDFRAERRRSEWQRARKAAAPFEFAAPVSARDSRNGPASASDLDTGSDLAPASDREWRGQPMSPGVVTGRAFVAEHIEDARDIEEGTILITTSPNPALTPIYPLLGGLVSATGGALSHGFVSAREYALPAVSGIAEATRKFPTGTLVRVDGSTGRVEVLPS